MSDVLVLNASYEPLSRVCWERAITLVVQGKAVIDQALPDRFIRYQKGQFPWPSIIRMKKYIKTPYHFGEIPFTKQGVLKRDNHTCGYCGKAAENIDHIQPLKTHPHLARSWENCVASCIRCNSKKDCKTLKESGLTLIITPYTPRGLIRRRGIK